MGYVIILLVALALGAGIFLLVRYARKKPTVEYQTPSDIVGLEEIFHFVWVECFDMKMEDAPRLIWVVGNRLNCANGYGWKTNGQCVGGLSWKATRTCSIAWVPGMLLSQSAFVHELWHAATWLNGEEDPNHTGPGFAVYGPVDLANRALREMGR